MQEIGKKTRISLTGFVNYRPNGLVNKFCDLLFSLGLSISNDLITRPSTFSNIDHIVSNIYHSHRFLNFIIENYISNHNAIIVTFFYLLKGQLKCLQRLSKWLSTFDTGGVPQRSIILEP